jgi:hypothetical protein
MTRIFIKPFCRLDLATLLVLGAIYGCDSPTAQEDVPPEHQASEDDEMMQERPSKPKPEVSAMGYVFLSSEGVGGLGAIRDLKFAKGDTSTPSVLSGYHKINVDLNRGAGGTYIYLTFTRDKTVQQGPLDECPPGYIQGDFVTNIIAEDYAWGHMKGKCLGSWTPPIYQATGSILAPWKHPDLNDGAGGRYIFAWQERPNGSSMQPIREVGVVAGAGGTACPTGWSQVPQDLNQGAGGDYIYFCFKR